MNNKDFIRVATLDELKSKKCIVVRGAVHPIAVFYHDGQVHAVDNRCPHMGFPLSRGSVHEGILTCHWHHARFDLSSGCTFDLFADDVLTADVEIRDGEVFVARETKLANRRAHWKRRQTEGMAQNISLVIAKAVIALQREGVDYKEIVRDGVLFGVTHRDGWASGLTILTAMANLAGALPDEERFLALFHGLSRVANDCDGQVPRRERHPLEGSDVSIETLKDWLRNWTRVRHRDAAERTLLTAISNNASREAIVDMLLTAATDRFYADGGHTLDFINKSFEVLDLIGWEHAEAVLPSVVRGLVAARGGEESSAWRHPVDLVTLLHSTFERLPNLAKQADFRGEVELAERIRADDPHEVIDALIGAIQSGATPLQLSKSVCLAAAMRIARFGTSNEFGDWITALHTFTYCNALHQALKRLEGGGKTWNFNVARGIFHGAMSVYLDRFLNVPPAALPGERDSIENEPNDAQSLLAKYLEELDSQQRVTAAARVIARYLSLKHTFEPLIAALARGVLREDADFHTFQMLEAAVQQHREWQGTPQADHILVALARYSAAHSPTQRAALQTAEIALRLNRGKSLHEEES